MKTIRILSLVLTLTLVVAFASSCYIAMGTTMKKAKGTYELTSYSITDGKTNEVRNKITEDGVKVYLVVTGESRGYYVYQSNDTPAYYREVNLSYEYSEEDSKKLTYVIYRFDGADSDQRLGVNAGSMNFSRPAIKLSDKIYSDGISMSWKKVSSAVDLSYVTEQMGEIPPYVQP